MKNIHKNYHTIEDIFYKNNSVILECCTSIKKFDNIKSFWSSIFGDLKFIEVHREKFLLKYQVELYKEKNAVGSRREEFHVVLKNGRKERVWKPGSNLNENAMPQGYSFTNRYLNLYYQKNEPEHISVFTPILKNIEYGKQILSIEGYLFLPRYGDYDISKFKMQFMKFREEETLFEFPFQLTLAKNIEIFGFFMPNDFYKFNDVEVLIFYTQIPLNIISSYSGIFNIVIENSGKTRLIQNYHTSFEKIEKTSIYNIDEQNLAFFNFYYDDIVTVWRFEIYKMSQSDYLLLNLLKNQKRENDVWLIGEYTISARDNGMHFYTYMLNNHPEIEFYYIIEKSSKDIKNLNLSKVIEYGSYQHFEVSSRARVLAFSHMPTYLIPKINSITSYKNHYEAYLKVFLQHGVIATTTSMSGVRKSIRKYNLFNVSSTFEKEIITKYLHYDNTEVIINGLPRWDRLYIEKRTSNTIIIIPTYRNDLEQVTEAVFLDSKYFKFWNNLLTNGRFIKYIEENNIKIHFFIHIILSRFIHKFRVNSENISLKNNDNLQDLLLNCGMLVTDYSSVSFDALFQNKPVVYVPFDFEEMITTRGGEQYIDYKKDLPGEICRTIDDTIDEIIARVESGWVIADKYRDRRLKFFKYIDASNSERVYESIILKLYSKYNKNEVTIHKFKQLRNGDLEFKVFSWREKSWSNINPKLILKSRKVSLSEEPRTHSIVPSSLKIIKNHYFLATFIVPLEEMVVETGTILHIWDFYLDADTEYRVKYSNKLEMTFRKLNYDFVPYSTIYKNFSMMAIRKEATRKPVKYKKSITFILFRIDLRGGVTKVTIDLANALAEKGYKVTLIAIDMVIGFNNFFISPKVNFKYVSINLHRNNNLILSDIYSKKEEMDMKFITKLKEYFSDLNTDFVYFPIYGSSLFLNLLEAIPHHIKKIIGDHSGRRYRIYDELLRGDQNISFDLLLKLTTDYHLLNNLTKIDAIHVINPLVKPIFNHLTDRLILDIPNIINMKRDTEELLWSNRNKTIIAVGSLSKVKKFDTLIKAFNNLEKEFPTWRLQIYGEGSERSTLERLIQEFSLEEKVLLKGFSSNIKEQFTKSMIHVSVSSAESFGLTMVEAMSQGTITLSTNTTIGAKYLLEDEETGFLADSNSEVNIVKKLKYLLVLIEENNPLIKDVQEKAYLKSQQFNAKNISDKWDSALSLLF